MAFSRVNPSQPIDINLQWVESATAVVGLLNAAKQQKVGEPPNGYTYFVLNPLAKLLKVGRTSEPVVRLPNLECQVGTPLTVVAVVAGEHWEKLIHDSLPKSRSLGEWFHVNDNTRGMVEFVVFNCGAFPRRLRNPIVLGHPMFQRFNDESAA